MPEDIYKQDRFYVDLQNDEIIWLYHNPDAFSGDQFVRNRFGIDLLKEAIEKCPIGPDSGYEAYPVYDYIESSCRQYLSDVGSAEYGDDIILFQTEPFAIALTQTTLDKLQLLFKAKELINDYRISEFGDPAGFSDPAKVGIAYTTTEDDKHEIQVYANLVDFQTEVWLDGENVANLHLSFRCTEERCVPRNFPTCSKTLRLPASATCWIMILRQTERRWSQRPVCSGHWKWLRDSMISCMK